MFLKTRHSIWNEFRAKRHYQSISIDSLISHRGSARPRIYSRDFILHDSYPNFSEVVKRLLSFFKRRLPHQSPTLAEPHHEKWTTIHKNDFNFISKFLFEPMRGCDAAKPATQNQDTFHISPFPQ